MQGMHTIRQTVNRAQGDRPIALLLQFALQSFAVDCILPIEMPMQSVAEEVQMGQVGLAYSADVVKAFHEQSFQSLSAQ